MAKAYSCDVCTKYYKYSHEASGASTDVIPMHKTVKGKWVFSPGGKAEVCPKCFEEINSKVNSIIKFLRHMENEK